jgi:glycosyltransferase involved in cell wall biosynthesis
MVKLKFTSDPANTSVNGSTNIIVQSLNNALKKLDLYEEEGLTIHYDSLGNTHGLNPQAILTVYELNFPQFILNNLAGRPMIGCSKDNMAFAINAGYPPELCRYVPLGVDCSIWKPIERVLEDDGKFVVLSFSESQTRGGFEDVLMGFCSAFSGQKDVVLYLKDRETTDKFRTRVQSYRDNFEVNIILDDRNLVSIEEQNGLFSDADVMLYLNYSTTWGLISCQSLAAGCPLMAMSYCGPAEYLSEYNGFKIDYFLQEVDDYVLNVLQDLGLRNYLFPRSCYHVTPYWARPVMDDVVDKLRYAYNHREELKQKRINAVATAQNFSWERSAMNFSRTLAEYL